MAITIMKSSITPSRKSTSAGTIRVDTGAAEYNKSLSSFGATANQAVTSYFEKKAQAEQNLQSATYDASIDNSLLELQQRIMDPTSEVAEQPFNWEQLYEEGADEIFNSAISTTTNKALQTSILNSWNVAKIKYEKELVKESTARTQKLLKNTIVSNLEKDSAELVVVDDLDDLTIISEQIKNGINSYLNNGFNSATETELSLYEQYIGDAIKNRIINTSKDLTISEFMNAYDDNSFGEGHEITNAMMLLLNEEQLNQALDDALAQKTDRIKLINDHEDEIEKQYQSEIENDILVMESINDPLEKKKVKLSYYEKYANDDDAIKKIQDAFYTNPADETDSYIEIGTILKDVNFGKYSLDEIASLKPSLSKEDYAQLLDAHKAAIAPSSPANNRLRTRIKNEIFSSNDGFIQILQEEDPFMAAMFNDALSAYTEMFEERLANIKPGESQMSIYDEVIDSAQNIIELRKVKTAEQTIIATSDLISRRGGVAIDMKNIEQSIKDNMNSDLTEFGKRNLKDEMEMLKQLYGPDIFKKIEAKQ